MKPAALEGSKNTENVNPRCSVIIPTYNRAALVIESIDSVLGQDFDALEVVIVDDGSTDGTYEALERLKSSKIRVIRTENRGAPHARNVGFHESRGQLVKFLDSDDLLAPGSLAAQVSEYDHLETGENDIVTGFHEIVREDGSHSRFIVPTKKVRSLRSYDLSDVVNKNPPTSAPLYKREHIEAIGGFQESLPVLQDYDMAFRVASSGFRYRYFPTLTYRMRSHSMDPRISTADTQEKAKAHWDLIESHWKIIQDDTSQFENTKLRFAIFNRICTITRKLRRAGYQVGPFEFVKYWVNYNCLPTSRGLANIILSFVRV